MPPTGTILQGRYEILRPLGQGGMSIVYLAADNRLGQVPVAVKKLDATQLGQAHKQSAIDAIRQEALTLAKLNHPGIARVMDYFSNGDYLYLVMEYVQGETLEEAISRTPRGYDEQHAIDWIGQLAQVLDYLHRQNPPIIFRDLKPSNIMVQPDGKLKLIDFGIARMFKPGKTADTQSLGTPGYAAPEQYGRGQTDTRSDVYSLGVVVHRLLTGYDPTLTPMRLPSVRQLRPDLPPQIEAAIDRALQLDPSLRFSSVRSFATALGVSDGLLNLSPVLPPTASLPRQVLRPAPSTTGRSCGWAVLGLILVLLVSAAFLSIRLGWVDSASIDRLSALISNVTNLVLRRVVELYRETVHYIEVHKISLIWGTVIVFGLLLLLDEVAKRKLQPQVQNQSKLNSETQSPETPENHSQLNDVEAIDNSLRKGDGVKEWPATRRLVVAPPTMVIEELILYESYERLKRYFRASQGGRHLITGYGRFGGTSLVTSVMRDASDKSSDAQRLLVFNCQVDDSKGIQETQIEIQAGELNVAMLQGGTTRTTASLREMSLRYELPFPNNSQSNPERKTTTTQLRNTLFPSEYSLSQFASDLSEIASGYDRQNVLQQLVDSLPDQSNLLSRVILIIDKVTHQDTLKQLYQYGLFQTPKITVIAIARREDYDKWSERERTLATLGFDEWYIPCNWPENSIVRSKLRTFLLQNTNSSQHLINEQDIDITLKHFEFLGKGILGETLVHMRHFNNWNFAENGDPYLAIDDLVKRKDVRANGWIQDILNINWDTLIGSLPSVGKNSTAREDRARIGVYYLIDWIADQTTFSKPELLVAANHVPITISENKKVTSEVIERLIHVFEKNKFLRYRDDGDYEIIWKPRRATPKRVLTQKRPPPITPNPSPAMNTTKQPSVEEIVRFLAEKFTIPELRQLMFELNIDDEELGGNTKTDKARELTNYCERNDDLKRLVELIRLKRPRAQL